MSSEEQKQQSPFTESFNLENPNMIDTSFLNEEEKRRLLSELQRSHDFGAKFQWTGDHQNLLLRLKAELSIDETNAYVPDKDKPFYKRR